MKTSTKVVALGAGLAMALPAVGAAPAAPQAPIIFSDLGGVRSWRAGGDTVVFVQSKAGQWYKAEMQESCMQYDTKKGIRFITEIDPDTNAKISAVVVERRICRVTSLTKVDKPDGAK